MGCDVPAALMRAMIYGCAEHCICACLRGKGDFCPGEPADSIVDLFLGGPQRRAGSRKIGDTKLWPPGSRAPSGGPGDVRPGATMRRLAPEPALAMKRRRGGSA